MGNLKLLQDGLKKLWTNELYSKTFNASPVKHKDFDHALKHVRKATQALENMTEVVDHSDEVVHDPAAIRKYIADIIISAVRLANVCPTGEINVEQAVFNRVEQKMGAAIERETDFKEFLRWAMGMPPKIWDTIPDEVRERWKELAK
jgi:hypothetical protein